MDTASFLRYLVSKKTVDDRALNSRVWEAMVAACNGRMGRRVLELGGGIGTMIERVMEEGRLRPESWTLIDSQPACIAEAERRLPATVPFPVELLAADLDQYLLTAYRPFDLVVANAFLDLLAPARALPEIARLGGPGTLFLFSITFDGLTAFEPEIDRALDDRICSLYHRSMDERVVHGEQSGDSRCGRHLLTLLPRCGYLVLQAGSSDWIVYPRDGAYPADERFFLSCILDFVEQSLTGRRELDRLDLRHWLGARRAQLDAGSLVFMAHQLDVLAASTAAR
jgi:SAM-dependent methyltransferase